MAYNVKYKKSIERDLKRLDKTEARRILGAIEKELPANADSTPTLKGPFAGLRKYRIGDYRVIFAVLDQDILILRIAHRKEAYKRPLRP